MSKSKLILLFMLFIVFSGCDDGGTTPCTQPEINTTDSNSSFSSDGGIDTYDVTREEKIVGYFIDAPVANVSYECGDVSGKTDSEGKFECSYLPVTFKIDNLVIGSLDVMTDDKRVYPQDLVGVPRSDVSNPKVLKIASFLQSIDDDGVVSENINIPDDISFDEEIELADMSQTEMENMLHERGISPVSLQNARIHLSESLPETIREEVKDEIARELEDANNTINEATNSHSPFIPTLIPTTVFPPVNRTPYTGTSSSNNLDKPDIENASAVTVLMGTKIKDINFTNNGGNIDSCSVSPNLPSGLSIDNNCTISGTPTVTSLKTTYTVTAKNSGGTDSATVDITINSSAPSLENASAVTVLMGTKIKDINFTNNGGNIDSCSVSPNLPSGLSIDNNCTISGTPTVTSLKTTYTVTAKNSGGTDSATVDITINSSAPSLENASAVTVLMGTKIKDINFTNNGGNIDSCSVSPNLPSGLSIDNNCTISGTPTVTSLKTTYTVTAKNSGGTDSATVDITINSSAPSLENASAVTVLMGTKIKDINFTNNGGNIDSCSVSPNLPSGLSIDNNCTISGTPTVTSLKTTYTVTAKNSGGTDSATVDITINSSAPSLENASAVTVLMGTKIKDINFTNNGGNIDSCSVSPNLPSGLSIDNNCTISGTPTVTSLKTTYTVTAKNSGGTDSATVDITINSSAPSLENASAVTVLMGTKIKDINFTNNGGNIDSCSVSPNLPSGLSIDNNCTISGTPTVTSLKTTYTVTAKNSGGTDSATVDITINSSAPSLENASAVTVLMGTKIKDINFTNNGGNIDSCSVSPNLPSGLSIDNNCTISGTPTVTSLKTTYTVTAKNSGGTDSATVDITINSSAPSLENASAVTAFMGVKIKDINFTNNGGNIDSCSVSPNLPSGLSIDNNCTISGTPTIITSKITYTVTAKNSSGTDSATVDIMVTNELRNKYSGNGIETFFIDKPKDNFNYRLELGENYKDVYIIFTNPESNETSIAPSVVRYATTVSSQDSDLEKTGDDVSVEEIVENNMSRNNFVNVVPDDVTNFNNKPPKIGQSVGQNDGVSNNIYISNNTVTVTETDKEGDTATFYDASSNKVEATCKKVIEINNKKLNIWVANDSFGTNCKKVACMTQDMVDIAADGFLKEGDNNDIYEYVTNILGEEWGETSYEELITDNDEITILFFDINNDNSNNGGTVGFFYAKDNYKKTYIDTSNERIMFYMDSVMYATKDGDSWDITDFWPKIIMSTLAHEFQHMIHFYQKNVVHEFITSEIWLNEMCSMSIEDIVAKKIGVKGPRGVDPDDGTAGSPNNVEGRLPLFVQNNFVALTDWYSDTEVYKSYAISYSFGAFLMRNYGGTTLLREIVHNDKGDHQAVVEAVNKVNDTKKTFSDLLREWGVATVVSDDYGDDGTNGYKYNVGDFFPFEENGLEYKIGSISMYNYGEFKFFDDTRVLKDTEGKYKTSNLYYKVGEKLTGDITLSIAVDPDTEMTVVVK